MAFFIATVLKTSTVYEQGSLVAASSVSEELVTEMYDLSIQSYGNSDLNMKLELNSLRR
jgi:hypothetical protein